jgi:hypothetical protein
VTKSPLSHIILYIIGLTAFFVAHKLYPTDLAGPGLDFLVLLVFTGAAIFFYIEVVLINEYHESEGKIMQLFML